MRWGGGPSTTGHAQRNNGEAAHALHRPANPDNLIGSLPEQPKMTSAPFATRRVNDRQHHIRRLGYGLGLLMLVGLVPTMLSPAVVLADGAPKTPPAKDSKTEKKETPKDAPKEDPPEVK